MKYPKTRINTSKKIKAWISGMTANDATNKILAMIQNNYRRRERQTEAINHIASLCQHLEWREDYIVTDAEEGNNNAYSRAKAFLNNYAK